MAVGGEDARHVEPETLGAWAEGRLGGERARAVEAHVASCDECLAAVASVAAAPDLARYAAPLTPAQRERLERLAPPQQAPRAARRRRGGSGRRPAIAAPWLATAKLLVPLAAAIVVGLLLLSHTRLEERPQGSVALAPTPSPDARPTATPARSPAATPAPARSPAPEAAPDASPRPERTPADASPAPEEHPTPTEAPRDPALPGPGASPLAPTTSPAPATSPSAWPSPGGETATQPSPAPGGRPVEVELAQGSCTLGRRALRAGERTTVHPGEELVASSGARLRVHGSELLLKGTAALEERTEAGEPLVAARLASGELLLAVAPAGEAGAAAPAFEVAAGSLRGRPRRGGASRVLCSLAPDRAQLAALEGEARAGDVGGELAVDLPAGQELVARKGARAAGIKPEPARGGSWTAALLPREAVVSRATFEASADGWDEEERVSPGFGGSQFGLKAVPTGAGQPWRFLALRTRTELDPARHALRFRFRTPLPAEPLLVTVYRLGAPDKLVATVRPPATKDTWALFDLRLSAFAREAGAGDGLGLGADRKTKIVLQQGTEHDPVPADFVIDDFEILERGP